MGIRTKIRHFRRGLKNHNLPSDIPIFVTEWNASSKDEQLRGQGIGHLICIAQGLLELNDSRVHGANFWPLQAASKGLINPAGEFYAWLQKLLRNRLSLKIEQKPALQHVEIAAFSQTDSSGTLLLALNRSTTSTEELSVQSTSNPAQVNQLTSAETDANINSLTLSVRSFQAPISNHAAIVTLPPLSITAMHLDEPAAELPKLPVSR